MYNCPNSLKKTCKNVALINVFFFFLSSRTNWQLGTNKKVAQKMDELDELETSALRFLSVLLHVSGFLPPPCCKESQWKMKVYDTLGFLSLFMFYPAVVFQMMYVYQNMEDLEKVTEALFQMIFFIMIGIMSAYFWWKRRALKDLFNFAETNFTKHLKKVGSQEKQKAIFTESYKMIRLLVNPLLLSSVVGFFAWVMTPFLLRYVDLFLLNKSVSDLAKNKNRYFVVSWWTPDDVYKSPKYEMIQGLNMLITTIVVADFTSICFTVFILEVHITSLFKILCSAFEEMDLIVTRKPILRESLSEKPKENELTDQDKGGEETRSGKEENKAYSDNEDDDRVMNILQMRLNLLDSNNCIAVNAHNNVMQKYLVDCIKFHQEIIR